MELKPKHLDEIEHALAAAIEEAMREFASEHERLQDVLPEGGDGRLHHLMAKAAAAALEAYLIEA